VPGASGDDDLRRLYLVVRRIAARRPTVVGPMLDRQTRHRRQQALQDLAALLRNRPVTAAATGCGTVDYLAAEHIDPIEGQGEEFRPYIYSHRPVAMAAMAAGRCDGAGFGPEAAAIAGSDGV
jgi:hypothetical protein